MSTGKDTYQSSPSFLFSDCRGGAGAAALCVGNGDAAADPGDPDTLLGDTADQPGHGTALPP